MLAKIEQKMIYRGSVTRKSAKTGNEYTLITIADPVKFESYDFMKNNEIEIPHDLVTNDECHIGIEISKNGYNNVPNLVSLMKAK